MIDLLKDLPSWFLLLIAALASSFAVWSLSRSISKLDKTIEGFQELFRDHEKRLSTLEGAHAVNHKD